MMKKKIAITGANGVVGKTLTKYLKQYYTIVPIDLPEIDILKDKEKLEQAFAGVDTVIHLAVVLGSAAEGKEGWLSPHRDPVNEKLFNAVVKASHHMGVKKFIHASSVHVEDTRGFIQNGKGRLKPIPSVFHTEPVSGYGHAKRDQEAQLQSDAKLFSGGVVSVRLGGVRPNNLPIPTHEHADADILDHERRVWLEHSELADLMKRIIDYARPIGYDVVYAISDNDGRIHDATNRYGWQPTANSGNGLY